MKIILLGSIIFSMAIMALTGCGSDGPEEPLSDHSGLVINEFMAENDTLDVDGTGGTPDWIEIYNTGTEDVDIRGWFMTDEIQKDVSSWYHLPLGPDPLLVPAGGWLVLFANNHPEMGKHYLDFKLSDTGESIGLANVVGAIVDTLVFEQQTADLSMGRFPDGIGSILFLSSPTPGTANTGEYGNQPPVVIETNLDPVTPLPDEDVTVIADIFDDDGILAVSLFYKVDDDPWTEVVMNEFSKTTNSYSGTIPGQAQGAVVGYYLLVTDTAAEDTFWPEGAPEEFITFTPIFQLPHTLYINEFMASNNSFDVDGTGEYPDWVEVFNPGTSPVDIGGMFITDDLDQPQQWQIPTTEPATTTIEPGGYIVLFADKLPELGVLHVDVKLSSTGEDVGLFADNGSGYILLVDGLTYDSAVEDISEGRVIDGSETWTTFVAPTPGSSNSALEAWRTLSR